MVNNIISGVNGSRLYLVPILYSPVWGSLLDPVTTERSLASNESAAVTTM